MSTPASTQASAGVFTYTRGVSGLSPFQTIFTVPNISPVLIESVYFLADFGGLDINSEALVLRIVAPGNAVVFAQSTPIMDPDGTGSYTQAYCTWARGASGTSGEAPMKPIAIDITPPIFNTVPLPDMTMPPLTTIGVALYVDNQNNPGSMTLQGVSVTYTPNGGPLATTDTPQGIPLLTDVSTG